MIGIAGPVDEGIELPVHPPGVTNTAAQFNGNKALEQQLVECFASPLRFSLLVFPWGEPGGPLEEYEGPDKWQTETLLRIERAIREGLPLDSPSIRLAISSGHGIGKTALVSWLILWFISTRPRPQIVVTANTQTQLTTKTWRELAKWKEMAIHGHWFEYTATQLKLKDRRTTWYATAVPWSSGNASAFAGTHEDHVLVVMDEACHDDQTDVMTDSGWMKFADLTGKERLLTMDPKTRVSAYHKPTALVRHRYVGKLLAYKQRGANFVVTPNHIMVLQSPDGKGGLSPTRKVKAGNLSKSEHRFPRVCEWKGKRQNTFVLPEYQSARKNFPEMRLDMDLWLEFLGWYCSEGSLAYYKNGKPHSIRITNTEPKRIAYVARRLGFTASVYEYSGAVAQVGICNTQLARWLHELGRGCLKKRVPGFIRHLASEQIAVYLQAHKEGDGYSKNGRTIIYTSCPGMADDLQELMLKTGRSASVSVRRIAGKQTIIEGHVATSSVDGYVVREMLGNDISYRHANMSEIDYDGTVYCAEVPPNNTLLTRRNGCVLWSGNSEIDAIIWETAEGAMTTPGAMWFAFGNPTDNTGRFRQCWTKFRKRWITRNIDSRTAMMANRQQLDEWIEDYGIDSDFVKVRILGQFPSAGSKQFIASNVVEAAQARSVKGSPQYINPRHVPKRIPRIMGVDIGSYGSAQTVVAMRHGNYLLPKLYKFRDANHNVIAGHIAKLINEWSPDIVFIDATGYGHGVFLILQTMGFDQVVAIYWGDRTMTMEPLIYYNPRIEIWARMAKWLESGSISYDQELFDDLIGPELLYDIGMRQRLEPKESMEKRGIPSPDSGDAVAFTFAQPVPVKRDASMDESMTEPEVD